MKEAQQNAITQQDSCIDVMVRDMTTILW